VIKLRVKIVINTMQMEEHDLNELNESRSEIWSGEMDILSDRVYLTKISLIAEGHNEPICEVPFSPTTGYYKWISPTTDRPMDVMPESS
jgi:hypothetical protein